MDCVDLALALEVPTKEREGKRIPSESLAEKKHKDRSRAYAERKRELTIKKNKSHQAEPFEPLESEDVEETISEDDDDDYSTGAWDIEDSYGFPPMDIPLNNPDPLEWGCSHTMIPHDASCLWCAKCRNTKQAENEALRKACNEISKITDTDTYVLPDAILALMDSERSAMLRAIVEGMDLDFPSHRMMELGRYVVQCLPFRQREKIAVGFENGTQKLSTVYIPDEYVKIVQMIKAFKVIIKA